ncbi:MAG: N-acylglucosamine 2-epimerase [Planctomycetes bacterium GWF2_42_9]|nr:MAG: N-acylglucosamine 2-epimerase [Planctomycetes bacterium GWF2_42_9]
MALKQEKINQLIEIYRDGLLNDTMPFWLNHCMDKECGGYFFALDRDGSVLSTDKYVWLHGRLVWVLSTMFSKVEPRQEWLDAAEHGLRFLRQHAFDAKGKMYFSLDRQGRPLRMRRYIFSEAFMVAALAAYAQAKNDKTTAQEALVLFKQMIHYHTTPGLLEPKYNQQTRPMKGLVMPMIFIVTAQILREVVDDPICNDCIERSILEIESDFMKPELQMVLEAVTPRGELIDTLEGRMVTPGHAIEAAWFIMVESAYRNHDARLRRVGLTILDWMWNAGWDKKYGGLLYYVDAKGKSCSEYWHDMKFWWPHNETIIATLMAYQLTRDEKYCQMFEQVHEWAYDHFPDKEYGEWFGYLHRDGSISTELKGSQYKGAFHLPRMQLICAQLLEQLKADNARHGV